MRQTLVRARQARLAYAAVHDRIDEDGLAYRQIAVRLCQVADEFMAEDRAGLSTDVFTAAICRSLPQIPAYATSTATQPGRDSGIAPV